MNFNYEIVESAFRPSPVEIFENVVYLRKNIKKEERVNEDGVATIWWTYEEVKLTPAEFNDYSKALMVDNMTRLVEGQENGDNNQLIIMEAIADLYDVIASMM